MQLTEHILYGGSVTAALYPTFGIRSLFFFLGSVLIDIDHYVIYLYFSKFKDWNVKKMFQFHSLVRQWLYSHSIYVLLSFHTVEFLLLVLIFAFWFGSVEIYLIFFGLLFHLLLDTLRMYQLKKLEVRALSFVEYWIRKRKMEKSGVDPEKILEEVYRTISQDEH